MKGMGNNSSVESNISHQPNALEEFYSIALAKDLAFVDQVYDVLRLGCRYLGLCCGIMSYVEGNRYTILHVHTESDEYQILPGDVFDLGLTYCKFTLEQERPVGFHHAAKTDIAKHPSYNALKLEAYLGAPTYLNNRLFGTLNFTSIKLRNAAFTEDEIHFVQLVAEWISSELNRNYRQEPSLQQHITLSSRLEISRLARIEMTPAFEVTKWRGDQVIGKSPMDWPVINQNDLDGLVSSLANLRKRNGNVCAFSCDLRKNNGQLISTEWFISCEVSDSNVQVYVLDITDRVKAENELLRKSAFYQDLFQNAPDMYMSLDRMGNIISANNLCESTLGYQPSELIGIPYWNLIQKADVRRVHRLIDVAFSGDVDELEMEVDILRKDNSVIKSHQRIRIIQAKKDMPCELRIIARDITEQKRGQEIQLEYIKHQRDEIGLEVQHRIKNSLQAVIGMITVSMDSHPELKPILTTSIAQVNTISIVNGLIMNGKDDVELLYLLDNLIEESSKLFNCDIDFNKNTDGVIQLLVADEIISISLIVTELLINALKYHAENSSKENYIRVNINSTKDGVKIEIINTCIDMADKEDCDKNIGISMIKSLLPPYGARLDMSQDGEIYTALLELKEPVMRL